ncbi:MAG TPA: hypothetical protein DEG17_07345 [Cyanobacteria bacterium UBA11149]|nr:hypothetical protein [Cyanobacteria bacterium UBA11367]HBE55960.1 hypothetical protein [Cyanobacteria bacterium UBA11366]HBK63188.1 hypothetical protein [Cyanobacteria bacterium UBA11166]HBR74744.1 hypothetical protein [Cyanobacteria bacterium UBA11159]HBS72533.1 hypothetical protein [Cyanobacteria bacterium UBA11153]HBW88680.1 hypothetical protein [Cyanobacteria bacterium UBA11149]HCA94514.1 hypothetical protein [Cyanobacteria bacterium UBA9226]
MIEEAESHEKQETVTQKISTPETFSIQWENSPDKLLDIPLNFPYSAEEWDRIFQTFISLLEHKDPWINHCAIAKLIQALEMEESQVSNSEDYQPKPTDERVRSIFEGIAAQTLRKPDIFENFCSRFQFLAKESPYSHLVLAWLNQLAEIEDLQYPTQEAILAAQIFFGVYNDSWEKFGNFLLEMLDSLDLNIRACAAYQIGQFCSKKFYEKDKLEEWDDEKKYQRDKESVMGMPPIDEIIQLIRSKEIERPGVAGAFWNSTPKKSLDAKEWLLDILANSANPEPYIPYFPCNLAFDAHERFSHDPDAIRRLIDMGRVYIAIAAATDESRKIPALEPLLIEMGNHEDSEIIRLASWHLAYFYHYLHPRGAELGYVELISHLSEIDVFLLFTREKEPESPYAAIIYPKKRDSKIYRNIAKKWVDRIFPKSVRGNPRTDLPPISSKWYQRGYIDYHVSEVGRNYGLAGRNSDLVDNVIIGYRSQSLWNPKDFL